ncbi:uncharacterized protein isoform X2 [Musca autumnalis]|uniref:uncharacterized protein isoform X2 n=1 Tax=Musca autumnalis TaxID=221902 RepID=UPI003CEC4580
MDLQSSFLNVKCELGTICLKCWNIMVDFDRFRDQSFVARKQYTKKHLNNYQHTICRICFAMCNEVENTHLHNEDLLTRNVVFKFLGQMILNDGLSERRVCFKCFRQIVIFYHFQKDVLRAHNKLIENENKNMAQSIINCNINPKSEETDDYKHHIKLENTANVKEEPETNNSNNHNVPLTNHESDEYKQYANVVIKEEPELQLIDVHSENRLESNQHMENINNDSSMEEDYDDDDDDYDPLKLPDERRKTIAELDAIIAKWRPNLECLVCGVFRPTFSLLQKHFFDAHPNVKCHIICCQCKLKTHYYIEEHLRYHDDPNTFKCKICGHAFITRLRLKRHTDYWHSEKGKKETKAIEDQSKLICNECGKSAKTLGALRKHIHRHEAKRKFKCTICDRGFRGRTDLRTHLASHANNTCFVCSVKFKNITNLRAHQAEVHGNNKEQHVIKTENEFSIDM